MGETIQERVARLEADNENTKGWMKSISQDVHDIRDDIKTFPKTVADAVKSCQAGRGANSNPPRPISAGTVDFFVRKILPFVIVLLAGAGGQKTFDSLTADLVPVSAKK